MNMRDLVAGPRERQSGSRAESMNPVVSLHREMNRLFEDMFRGFDSPALWGARGGWPSVDLEETDKEYRVTAELPGTDEKDIEVLLHDGTLILRGEKKVEKEPGNRMFSERFYGRFERQIPLDRDVDESAVNATFRNGILTVTVPKSAQSLERSKKIPINAPDKSQH